MRLNKVRQQRTARMWFELFGEGLKAHSHFSLHDTVLRVHGLEVALHPHRSKVRLREKTERDTHGRALEPSAEVGQIRSAGAPDWVTTDPAVVRHPRWLLQQGVAYQPGMLRLAAVASR